jgi:hypothetical protein
MAKAQVGANSDPRKLLQNGVESHILWGKLSFGLNLPRTDAFYLGLTTREWTQTSLGSHFVKTKP